MTKETFKQFLYLLGWTVLNKGPAVHPYFLGKYFLIGIFFLGLVAWLSSSASRTYDSMMTQLFITVAITKTRGKFEAIKIVHMFHSSLTVTIPISFILFPMMSDNYWTINKEINRMYRKKYQDIMKGSTLKTLSGTCQVEYHIVKWYCLLCTYCLQEDNTCIQNKPSGYMRLWANV